ncbi:GntR family transcriptional regulator [Mycolicibacterium canariasense]|uniref:GntR family transcriptional regulator n=1 Tax=Mycolicibacterium canariasense TaxID=228230 RepID=A0A100WFE1_MYCCR|nr:GntR family transcriptional regulator [Mycolicibacterium canariasense]MCV7209570.1 GntR family transcriptional regulator [Mycolicibacterium canariasense]ORU99503.1 GntR family transcriptional regulator [Mycolicibacterium canariasense]GAS97582.1 GntR family transcriptional regulator [Mycolicibacterium canariasense]
MTASDGTLLTESVHDALQELIFSGELAPGSPLSVPALAARLNVSRTPVREAVQQLIYEGLATHTRNAGARVTLLDDDAVKAVFEVREVLDGLAAHNATLIATRATVEQLRKMVEVQRELLDEAPDRHRDARLDLEFHTLIRDTARNRPLSDALARLDGQSHLYRSDMWTTELNRRLAVGEHERIVAAVEAGDAEGARSAACAHVAGLYVRTRRL